MAERKKSSTFTKMRVFSWVPHSPWQAGYNGNTDGLIPGISPSGYQRPLNEKVEGTDPSLYYPGSLGWEEFNQRVNLLQVVN
jgi:hypothetical protein